MKNMGSTYRHFIPSCLKAATTLWHLTHAYEPVALLHKRPCADLWNRAFQEDPSAALRLSFGMSAHQRSGSRHRTKTSRPKRKQISWFGLSLTCLLSLRLPASGLNLACVFRIALLPACLLCLALALSGLSLSHQNDTGLCVCPVIYAGIP